MSVSVCVEGVCVCVCVCVCVLVHTHVRKYLQVSCGLCVCIYF